MMKTAVANKRSSHPMQVPSASPAARATSSWQEAGVLMTLAEGRLLLDDGAGARSALSCLVVPEPGDRVLWVAGSDGERYVLHVLNRPQCGSVQLQAAGATTMTLVAPELRLRATKELSMASLADAELSAAGGRLTLSARDLTFHVLESLIHSARQMIGQCENWLLSASGLGRMRGRQILLTADEDLRADAERISLG